MDWPTVQKLERRSDDHERRLGRVEKIMYVIVGATGLEAATGLFDLMGRLL